MTYGVKTAAGELTARLARWASTPIPGTPRLLQRVRSGPELDALYNQWVGDEQVWKYAFIPVYSHAKNFNHPLVDFSTFEDVRKNAEVK